MSPPTASFQDKPAIVFEEPEKMNNRWSTRKLCIIATTVVVVLLIIAGTTFGAIAYNYHLFSKEHYETAAKIDDLKMPEHVRVDYRKELVFVSNEQKGEFDSLDALHNYGRNLLALFDLTVRKCFIDRLDETFDEALKYWSSQEGKERHPIRYKFDYTPEPIHPSVLRKFAGDDIANHCLNATSHWVYNIRPFAAGQRRKRAAAPAAAEAAEAAAAVVCREVYLA